MRISTFDAGLAVLASLPLVVASTNTPRILFPISSFTSNATSRPGGPQGELKLAIYESVQGTRTLKVFNWNLSNLAETVNVTTINLCAGERVSPCNRIRSNNGTFEDETQGGSTVQIDSMIRRQSTSGGLQSSGLPMLNVTKARTGGNIRIDLQTLFDHRGQTLFFEAVWQHNLEDGRSYSRIFAVVFPGENPDLRGSPDLRKFVLEEQDPNNSPFMDDVLGNGNGNGNGANTPSTAVPTRTGANNISPTKGFDDGGEDGNSEPSNSGLAAGAIAGIAIGGLAFLVLIVLVAWLIIRRRRKSNEEAVIGSYGHGRSRTDELMAEKEANAGIDAAPHSPYSDEGANNSLHQVNPASVPPVVSHHRDLSQQPLQPAHDAARSYTPYSDHPSAAVGSPKSHVASVAVAETAGRDGSPIPGRVTPHGMTQYAHLVEEGMTEDEIKRLEEEERALDAAIEQAGRRK